jgi:signal transduction histidine kinase
VQFREPSFWETYRGYIVSALAVIFLQAMLIAALLINRTRRVRSEKALDERLAFERLISDVSARLINARFENVDDEIEKALTQVLRIMDLDRCSVCAHEPGQSGLRITHSVDADAAKSVARKAGPIELPWVLKQLDQGVTVVLNDCAYDLPEEATAERSYAKEYGLKSVVVVPVAAAGEMVRRGVSYQSISQRRTWVPEVVSRLQLVSQILVTALAEKLATSALRASEEQLRLALQASRLGVWEWDRSTNLVKWSDARVDIADEPPPSTELTFDAWQAQVHADDLPRLQGAFKRAVEEKADVQCEYRIARTEGRYQWTALQANPTFASDGQCNRVMGLTADITDRKRIEEANVRLAHVSRLAAMGELTGSIAHEISQPLAAILNNADAADMLLGSSKPPLDEVRQIVTDIRSDALRAGEVIQHIRALMRKSELTIQPFDLNQAVSDVLNLVSVDLGKRRIAVTQEVAPLPIVHGDKIHTQQVVLNLIQNAADAMTDSPSLRRLEIRTGPSAEGGVEIAVSDSGHGIPADHLKRLFESFYTTKKEGMGLGLSIARSIVEAHGGRILAENRPGGGATFRVFLPLNPPTVRIWPTSHVDARAGRVPSPNRASSPRTRI